MVWCRLFLILVGVLIVVLLILFGFIFEGWCYFVIFVVVIVGLIIEFWV